MDAGFIRYIINYHSAKFMLFNIDQESSFPVPTAKARPGKNRDKPFYMEKALETCVLKQKYLSTDRLLGTTRELALILNMWSFPYRNNNKIISIYAIKK